MPETTDPRIELIRRFHADRPLAHATFFKHRHPNATPPFHQEMIEDWHSRQKYVLDLVFRGGAKSTIAEEALILKGCFREFKNAIIVGSNKDRAAERLHAIKREFESNDLLIQVFGDMVGPTWSDEEIVLANGRRILALGRGQSIRGIKFEDMRPDLVFLDDLEERNEAMDKDRREKVSDWLIRDLLPACDPSFRVRMAATPIHPDALPMRLKRQRYNNGKLTWITHTYPIYYLGEDGEPVSSWPERFPIEAILEMESAYRTSGDYAAWSSEYMCEAEAPETKPFRKHMIKVEPRVRTWQAVYSMTDPARTVKRGSATTGHVVWSWIGPKLVVWDAWARRCMPDEIVNALFDTFDAHSPVFMGFEEDGLNEWALQPIRQEQVRRGVALPLKAMKAPKGKIDFIRGLQPFFIAGEVEFAKPLAELEDQLLSFPSGSIDAPNALAYALKLRPGAPIYDNFGARHVAEDIVPAQGRPLWVCLNATRSTLTAVVLQVFDGQIRIFADAIREGEPGAALPGLLADLKLEYGANLKLTAGPAHYDRYTNVGLIAAANRVPVDVRNGAQPSLGQTWITQALEMAKHGNAMLMVSPAAKWTMNAFFGGYSRVMLKHGTLADYAEEGVYKTLIEGLESFCGLIDLGLDRSGGRGSFNAETAQGRPYHSMLAGEPMRRDLKSDWNALLRGER